MSFDQQIVRGEEVGVYNLAVGEPVIVQDLLGAFIPPVQLARPAGYPSLGGEQILLRELHRLHGDDCHIIVANGAKQALTAAMVALRIEQGKTFVGHAAPYWPSYPSLAKQAGCVFLYNEEILPERDILCITSPNNPNGSVQLDSPCDIWDAVYAHPHYGFLGQVPTAKIEIRSAAKMFGFSGLRVGWLVTKDDRLAQAAALYIESATSGVSVNSQEYLAGALAHFRQQNLVQMWTQAREQIVLNGKMFLGNIERYCERISGVPTGHPGMFAWFQVRPEFLKRFEIALERSAVRVVAGHFFGMPAEAGWYRMSMGHRNWYTAEALAKLDKAMYG